MERSLSRLSSYIENENVEVHLCTLSLTNRTEGIRTLWRGIGRKAVAERDLAIFGITAIDNNSELVPTRPKGIR